MLIELLLTLEGLAAMRTGVWNCTFEVLLGLDVLLGNFEQILFRQLLCLCELHLLQGVDLILDILYDALLLLLIPQLESLCHGGHLLQLAFQLGISGFLDDASELNVLLKLVSVRDVLDLLDDLLLSLLEDYLLLIGYAIVVHPNYLLVQSFLISQLQQLSVTDGTPLS